MIIFNINKVKILMLAMVSLSFWVFSSCGKRRVTIYNDSISKFVTIIDHYDIRHIYYNDKTLENYVKLDISKLDLECESIFICWNNENKKIEIVNPKARILEIKLDTSLYKFSSVHEVDNWGIPIITKFHQNDNIEFSILDNSFYPTNAGVKLSKPLF